MTQSESSEPKGLTEWILDKIPIPPHFTALATFIFIVAIWGILSVRENEIERFNQDITLVTVVAAACILLWAETWTGQTVRKTANYLRKQFPDDDTKADVKSYEDSIFSKYERVMGGVLMAAVLLLLYEYLGFWYSSPLLVMGGQVLVVSMGFVVGNLFTPLWYLFSRSKTIAIGLKEKIDVLEFEHMKAVQYLARPNIYTAGIAGSAGFMAFLGALFAPWQTTQPFTWIPFVLIGVIVLLSLLIFLIPLKAIHETLKYARDKKLKVISSQFASMYKLVEKDPTEYTDGQMQKIETLTIYKAQVQSVSTWPFGIKQFVGMVSPLVALIIQTYVIQMLYG